MIGKKINQLATELAPVSTDLTIIGDPDSGVSKKITLAQLGAIFSGAVSFYTNLASFPAVGDINVIYCAKDTQKLYLWSGSAYTEVFPSQALLNTYQLRSEKGVSNGYASLDSGGKVPISQLPSSIMEYKGTWSASTNTPTLANGTGDTGDVYICNSPGSVNFGAGAITFAVGDYVIYSGSIWQRSSGAVGTVTSVAASITGNAIGITGSPITTSGTLAFAFAGTGAQYIKGDGTLATFPNTISQAEKLITEVYNSTGATLTKGTIVYINGGQGNLPTVTKALATGDSTSAQTFGVVQADITNMNNGYVVVAGKLSDLDTQAYTPGTQLYLSSTTAGTWTSTKQYAPNHLVYIGIVVRAHPTQGIVEVKIQNGYELDELHNVAAQTPTNNDGLFWEASTSLWKNKSIATILGYTPQAQLNGTGFVKASGTTITYDNSTYLTTSAAATTYLPLVLSSTANVVDINGQQFNIWGSASGNTSGRIIVDPVFSAIGYQNAGVFDGLKILTNGNAEFSNSGITRFFNQVRFDSTLTNGTYTYTLPGATGTLALVSQLTGGTVTSVGLSSATSGVTIGSTPITTSGTITLAIATASGSQQGLLSSTDWTTFNNKQNALTNPVTGTGTTNYLPKFTGASTIGNSLLTDDGTTLNYGNNIVSIGASNTSEKYLQINSSTGILYLGGTSGEHYVYGAGNKPINFYTNGTSKMLLTASGNLGLGVTPSAWVDYKGFQIGNQGSIGATSTVINFSQNVYYGSSGNSYIENGKAAMYQMNDGVHGWRIAGTGTAGNAISFTQAMTLNASGYLALGTTNSYGQFTIGNILNNLGGINFENASDGSSRRWQIRNDVSVFGDFSIRQSTTQSGTTFTDRLYIASTGAATFSSSVTAGGYLANGSTTIGMPIDTGGTKAYFDASSINGPALTVRADGVGRTIRLTSDGSGSQVGAIDINSSGLNIGTNSSHSIIFKPQAVEAMRILPGGNVGIGTTSPGDSRLQISGTHPSGNAIVRIQAVSDDTASLGLFGTSGTRRGLLYYSAGIVALETNSDPLMLATNGTERMRITSGGNVGIGTSSPSERFEVNGSIKATGRTVSGTSVAGITISYESGVGYIESWQSSPILTRAYNYIAWDTFGSERMRITSGGNVGIGTSSPGCLLHIQAPAASYGLFRITSTSNSSGEASINFGRTDQNIDDRWTIGQGTAGSGNTFGFYTSTSNKATLTTAGVWSTTGGGTSDARTKQDIEYNFDNGIEALTKLQPTKFRFKSAPDKQRRGFIAQDVLQVIPDLVLGDGELKNGTYGLDYDGILALAVKAIQELKQELDTLKNK